MLNNIEWIFFDVGSTLVDESKAYQHRIKDMITGTDIDYRKFYDTMIAFYRQNKKGDFETAKQYGLILPEWHTEDEVLYPETAKCLKYLSSKYKIGVIANQVLGTKDRLKAFEILTYIDLVVASAEERIAKPDIRIFNLALKRAECSPQNAIMVGDRLDNDIAPANILGMKTIWIKQGFGRYFTPQTEMEKADYTVDNLNELCCLLK